MVRIRETIVSLCISYKAGLDKVFVTPRLFRDGCSIKTIPTKFTEGVITFDNSFLLLGWKLLPRRFKRHFEGASPAAMDWSTADSHLMVRGTLVHIRGPKNDPEYQVLVKDLKSKGYLYIGGGLWFKSEESKWEVLRPMT